MIIPVHLARRPLLGVAIVAAMAGCAKAPSNAAAHGLSTPPTKASFAGVWTTSTTSYEDASRATEATRFTAEGTLQHGIWGAKTGFRASPPVGPSRGFVPTFAIDAGAATITFFLDGAEEQASFAWEGDDRFKTVATTAEGTSSVYYVRKRR